MPSRNVVKQDAPESYYHVYARGASKQDIFIVPDDFEFFINLFARYLSNEPVQDRAGIAYPHYAVDVKLLAYCLMGNHFHLLLYQVDQQAMARLMKSIMTSYSRYFNFKYKRSGALFESTYKASRIENDAYLQHITRYIHLNPRYWKRYPYSSYTWYAAEEHCRPEWLHTTPILDLFASQTAYTEFVADYEEQKEIMDVLKFELADV